MCKPPICVVNHDTVFLSLMQELLTEERYAISTHTKADKSYEEIKRKQPTLVILDIRVGYEGQGWTFLDLVALDPGEGHAQVWNGHSFVDCTEPGRSTKKSPGVATGALGRDKGHNRNQTQRG